MEDSYESLSREDLIQLLRSRDTTLVVPGSFSEKLVYRAIMNYISNDLKLSPSQIREWTESRITQIVKEHLSSDTIQSFIVNIIDREVSGSLERHVRTILGRRLDQVQAVVTWKPAV